MIGRNGVVREVAFPAGPGPAWQVLDPPETSYGFDWKSNHARLIPIEGRTFAVDYRAAGFEFDLPASPDFGAHHLDDRRPLPIRVITHRTQYAREAKAEERLTRTIRPGYITVKSPEPGEIIAGVEKLAREVDARFGEIVVDGRWVPALFCRGKPIEEQAFCDILVKDGSNAARATLKELLDAYLEQTTGGFQEAWHTDDTTPTMGPVALALIRLCNPVPDSVMAFVAQRDMEHDNWTPQAWDALHLQPQRLAAPDMMVVRIRLAIQDISTGNVGADLFSLYDLADERRRLHTEPARTGVFANLIATQMKAQWPDFPWHERAPGAIVLKAITAALDRQQPAEMALAAALQKQLRPPALP